MAAMEADLVSFAVGETFESFSALEGKMKQYETSRSIQMTRRDCRLLESAKKRTPKRIEGANVDLKYYNLHYACTFGGKKYRPAGKGVRPRQSTSKQGCPAGIKFVLSSGGQHLVVSDICEDHNHEIIKIASVDDEDSLAFSQQQKYSKAESITKKVAQLCSEVGMADFAKRLMLLNSLVEIWSRGGEAAIGVRSGMEAMIGQGQEVRRNSDEVVAGRTDHQEEVSTETLSELTLPPTNFQQGSQSTKDGDNADVDSPQKRARVETLAERRIEDW
eukprot:m.224964 g.224964  ORF g.224964 m.224964 type:complete len:275 (+) comp40007_c2_seq11:48-872(+)